MRRVPEWAAARSTEEVDEAVADFVAEKSG
jgi:hypothetical protein